ncbi:MAG: hypothetical protein WCB04_08950, partial [Mycobacteriales bacterium]
PTAADLHCELQALGVQEPLRLPTATTGTAAAAALTHAVERPDPVPDPDDRGTRIGRSVVAQVARISRSVAARCAAVLVLLAAALTAGLMWGSGTTGSQPVDAGAVVAPSWPRVWADLDAHRARAFAVADATILADVYLPGCAAMAADLRAVRDLASRRASASGVSHQIRSLRVESAAEQVVTLLVVDRMNDYEIHGPAGEILARATARGDRRIRARLVHTAAGWRIAALAAA